MVDYPLSFLLAAKVLLGQIVFLTILLFGLGGTSGVLGPLDWDWIDDDDSQQIRVTVTVT